MGRPIAGTHANPDRCSLNVSLPGIAPDFIEGCFQVLMNIIVEGFQRRYLQGMDTGRVLVKFAGIHF
jgi:hypothetical protein